MLMHFLDAGKVSIHAGCSAVEVDTTYIERIAFSYNGIGKTAVWKFRGIPGGV